MLLDIDGTLLDLAATPAAVIVPPDLPDLLRHLCTRLGGALALISGRPIEQVDALFSNVEFAVAGEHGAALRLAPGLPLERPALPEVPPGWREVARNLAAGHPGVLFEQKAHGFVLHFRNAEASGPALLAALQNLMAGGAHAEFALVSAVLAWEVRPAGVDKGRALRTLMQRRPYAGRIPLFVGDDATDDDAIRAARELGGFGFKVGSVFGSPRGVRDWLLSLVETDQQGTPEAPCAGS